MQNKPRSFNLSGKEDNHGLPSDAVVLVLLRLLLDLLCEFSSWRQHQHCGTLALLARCRLVVDVDERRKQEGQCLSGSGLRYTNPVDTLTTKDHNNQVIESNHIRFGLPGGRLARTAFGWERAQQILLAECTS